MRLPVLILIVCVFVRDVFADVPADVRQFVATHCTDCHTGSDAEGGFKLESLTDDASSSDAVRMWTRVIDRVHDREMPPRDATELNREQTQAFTKAAGTWLATEQRQDWAERGRVRGRRLTNIQIERSLHDLLGIDIPLANQLPEEPRTDGFTTVADGQPMSHFQLQRHLAVVDQALNEGFRRALTPSKLVSRELTARELCRRRPQSRTREPELIDDKAVTWASTLIFYGRLPSTTARQRGWYRLTVEASALKAPPGRGVWCSARTGKCISSAPLLNWAGSFEAGREPRQWSFVAWLEPGDMFELRPADRTLKQARFAGGQVGTGEGGPQNVPGLALHSAKFEQIHRGPAVKANRWRVLGELELKADKDWRKTTDAPDEPQVWLKKLMRSFAYRAFRRPITDAEVAPYIELAQQELSAGQSFVMSLRAGYRALLCSPRFLYLREASGKLDAYAVASRLSYFLWNTRPDRELTLAAKEGRLEQPWQIRKQVDRMLKTPRGREFVHHLASEWLDLSLINFTEPDRRLYWDFDITVQQSMLDETHAFLQSMLDDDLSVTNLIDSDFTFLNSRLARYYGIADIKGDELRQVALKPQHRRGGLMTHGSILKVTANGTNTSPVVRGVWVAERLLGEHIQPPPQNVPAIEPDIRGAKTIRDQLAKHRSDASCAACHRKIDPPGFALENFDPSGKWRDRYLKFQGRKRVKGIAVDSGDTLPDGRRFKDLEDFQQLVTAEPQKLAANVACKLLTCGTGAPVTFADRSDIQKIVNRSAESDYGFRTLLTNVVLSDAFLNK